MRLQPHRVCGVYVKHVLVAAACSVQQYCTIERRHCCDEIRVDYVREGTAVGLRHSRLSVAFHCRDWLRVCLIAFLLVVQARTPGATFEGDSEKKQARAPHQRLNSVRGASVNIVMLGDGVIGHQREVP